MLISWPQGTVVDKPVEVLEGKQWPHVVFIPGPCR